MGSFVNKIIREDGECSCSGKWISNLKISFFHLNLSTKKCTANTYFEMLVEIGKNNRIKKKDLSTIYLFFKSWKIIIFLKNVYQGTVTGNINRVSYIMLIQNGNLRNSTLNLII